MIHYLDSSINTIKRARHVYFDDFASATPYEKLSPGGHLLRNESTPPIQETTSTTCNDKISSPTSTATPNTDDPVTVEKCDKNGLSTIKLSVSPTPSIASPKFDTNLVNLHTQKDPDPFEHNKLHTYQIDLFTHRHYPFGIFISYDTHYGLPFVKEIPSTCPWYKNLPAKFRRNI